MQNSVLLGILCLTLTACRAEVTEGGAATVEFEPSNSQPSRAGELNAAERAALIVDAEVAIAALAKPLQAQLQAALAAGGPVEALKICQVVAPQLAEAISAEHELTLRRVSLKHRNPTQGDPTDWQRMALETFEAELAAGTQMDELLYAYAAEDEFRYMKAIPTGRPCLACHGEQLAPEVSATLATLYPEDLAIGFKEGDIRGAFVVTKTLAPE
ncbi:MAG: DUF3365 domain-containing protein [Pseudomonadota bacterium]